MTSGDLTVEMSLQLLPFSKVKALNLKNKANVYRTSISSASFSVL